MIPKVIKVSEFRKNLSSYLTEAQSEPLVIQDTHNCGYVVLNRDYYNHLSSLIDIYKEEDPEGAYKLSFTKEMRSIMKDKNNIDPKVKSIKDI